MRSRVFRHNGRCMRSLCLLPPLLLFVPALACSRTSPATGTTPTASASVAASTAPPASVAPSIPTPEGATSCGSDPPCLRFATPEDAFRHVLAKEPVVLAIGEAHAQKGTEAIASSTKRFTESFL